MTTSGCSMSVCMHIPVGQAWSPTRFRCVVPLRVFTFHVSMRALWRWPIASMQWHKVAPTTMTLSPPSPDTRSRQLALMSPASAAASAAMSPQVLSTTPHRFLSQP